MPVVKELADFLIVSVVPAIESFVAGLTGTDGLAEGLSASQLKAVEWGKKVRSVIDTVIDLKDELIAVTAVIAGVFVVSKIAAGVTATIALINTVIKAYNLLKASAIVAGIASAFALNPLLGVGVVAVGAAVLAAANALVGSSDSGMASGPSTGSIPFASGFGPATGTGTTTGTGVSKIVVPSTTGITSSAKAAASAAAASTTVSNAFGAGSFRAAESATSGATYNINVTGAFDREGTAREIVNTINDSFYRGTGGGSNLAGIA